MPDALDQLRDLRGEAIAPPPSLDELRRRAAARARGRRWVRATGGAAAAAVLVAGIIVANSGGSRDAEVRSGPTTTGAATGGGELLWSDEDVFAGRPDYEGALFDTQLVSAGDVILTATRTLPPGMVVALDARTGERRWERQLTSDTDTAFVFGVGEGVAVIGPDHGGVVVVDVADGTERARVELAPGQGADSASIVDGVAYVGTSFGGEADTTAPELFAIDVSSGDVRWTTTLDPGTDLQWANPVVAGGLVLVANAVDYPGSAPATHMYALDAATGELRWRTELASGGQAGSFTESSPLAVGGVIVVPVAGPPSAIVALDLGDGAERWRAEGSYLGVHVVEGSLITGNPGQVIARDPATGAERWRVGEKEVSAVTGDGVYLIGPPVGVAAVDASSGAIRWSVPELTPSGPAVEREGSLYVPVTDGLVALDASTGKERWRVPWVGAEGTLALPGTGPLVVAEAGVVTLGPGPVVMAFSP